MINCNLPPRNSIAPRPPAARLRVCAVSYINTLPMVWGMTHGSQQNYFDLSFSVPSECADRLADGRADIGLVPCAELPRLNLTAIPGTGIASEGPVRSILLVSKVPIDRIQVLAADSSSRTSVLLARIILARKYGVEPAVRSLAPDSRPCWSRLTRP
jgi:Predicted periplasmic solute-binding protein